MSLTVSDLIQGAELAAFPYIPEEGTPRAVLIRQLSNLDSEVVSMCVKQNASFLVTAATSLPVVTATNPTGYTLSAARSWLNFQWVDSDDNIFPIRIVDEREYDHPPRHPAGIIRASKFYPCDPLELSWETSDARTIYVGDGDVITYSYVPEHTKLTTLAATMSGPDFARTFYEKSLALNIMLSCPIAVPQPKLAQMNGEAMLAKQELLLAIAKSTPQQSNTRMSGDSY